MNKAEVPCKQVMREITAPRGIEHKRGAVYYFRNEQQ